MKRLRSPAAILLVLALVPACPRPKDEGTDDGAGGETEAGSPSDSEGPGAGSSSTGAGPDLSCEDKLAKVTAELEACEGAK